MMTTFFSHESAVIDPGAQIGVGTKIWHFCHIASGAQIGEHCTLGQNVYVGGRATIGSRVKIQNNVSIYDGVEIADDVFLGPSCVFTNVNNPRSFVERKSEFRPTRVERGASIGANATIICGAVVGSYAFVGAGAVVTRSVPAHALVIGNPARRTAWMCKCGVKLIPSNQKTDETAAVAQYCCPSCDLRYEEKQADVLTVGSTDPVKVRSVPLLSLDRLHAPLRASLCAAFERVLDSSHFIMGGEVDAFETAVAKKLDVKHALGVSSGTDALLLALMALGIGPGDEVIVPTYTFFATAGAVTRVGATPVFVDVDPGNFCMTLAGFEGAVTQKTKAVVPVHLFGDAAPIESILAFAQRRNIAVVEDAAQALGARINGRAVGTLGEFGCYSFFPSKNLGALGDAGLLVTNDDRLAEVARRLRVHGAQPKYYHALIGGNFRLDSLQAALLGVKLPFLDRWCSARQAHAHAYDDAFRDLEPRGLQIASRGAHSIVNQYTLILRERDLVQRRLKDMGVSTEVYYPVPLHLQKCYATLGGKIGDFPVAEHLASSALSIPVDPTLTEAERKFVIDSVRAAVAG